MPARIQLSRRAGWRKPTGAVVVSRPSRWGNPFAIEPEGERLTVRGPDGTPVGSADRGDMPLARAVAAGAFEDWLTRPEQAELVAAALDVLAGHDLACWCPLDQPCHADAWLAIANREPRAA